MSKLKGELKAVRELIDAKKFDEGLAKCKELSSGGSVDYMSLVFGGLCASELGDAAAASFYARATQLQPDKLPAWQGLSKLYSSQSLPWDTVIRDCLLRLLDLLSPEKRAETELRLAECELGLGEEGAAVERLRRLLGEEASREATAGLIRRLFPDVLRPTQENRPMIWEALRILRDLDPLEKLRLAESYLGLNELVQAFQKLPPDTSNDAVTAVADKLATLSLLAPKDNPTLCDLAVPRLSSGMTDVLRLCSEKDWEEAADAADALGDEVAALVRLLVRLRLRDYRGLATSLPTVSLALRTPALKEALGGRLRLLKATAYVLDPRATEAEMGEAERILASPESAEELELAIRLQLKRFKVEGVWPLIQSLLRVAGESAAYWELLSATQEQEGRSEEALTSLRSGLAAHPDSAALHVGLGEALLRSGRRSVAVLRAFLAAAKLDPADAVAFLRIAEHYAADGAWAKAARCARRCLDVDVGGSLLQPAARILSDALAKEGDADEEQRETLEMVVEDGSEDGLWAWSRLALVHTAAGDADAAIALLQALIARSPLPDALHFQLLGEAYAERGSLESAAKALARALELAQEGGDAAAIEEVELRRLGVLIESAEFETARLGAAARLKLSDTTECRFLLMRACRGVGEAMTDERRAARAADARVEGLTQLPHLTASHGGLLIFWKTGADLALATARHAAQPLFSDVIRAAVKTMLEALPEHLRSKDTSGKIELRLVELAVNLYASGINLQSGDAELWSDLGGACYEDWVLSGLSSSAANCESSLLRSLGLRQTSAAWLRLGRLYGSQDRTDRAQHSLIRAVETSGGGEDGGRAWATLGLLYLSKDKTSLAHAAFGAAQSAWPGLPSPWIANAVVAHRLDHHDAADLFRHSLTLADTETGLRGYTSHLIRKLREDRPRTAAERREFAVAVRFAADAATRLKGVDGSDGVAELCRTLAALECAETSEQGDWVPPPGSWAELLLGPTPPAAAQLSGLGKPSEWVPPLVVRLLCEETPPSEELRARLIHSYPHIRVVWAMGLHKDADSAAEPQLRALVHLANAKEKSVIPWAKYIHAFPYTVIPSDISVA